MKLKEIARSLFSSSKENQRFGLETTSDALICYTTAALAEAIKAGKADEFVTAQYVTLKMLEEQGEAETVPNGFLLSNDVAVRLDQATQEVLNLPSQWEGSIEAQINGVTSKSSFSVDLKVSDKRGNLTHSYSINGPFIQFGQTQKFLLTPPQLEVFKAHEVHRQSDRSEYNNLVYLHVLQESKKAGCRISLSHFDTLKVHTPDSISVEAEFDSQGNLILTPFMGQEASHERIQKVLGQIQNEQSSTLKVGDEIILFDEEKMRAVKEILSNRVIPSSQVKDFLSKPTAYIDASLVDLDLGFSMRVHGATAFKHAYFGETDESGIDWFGKAASSDTVLPFAAIKNTIEDKDTLSRVADDVQNAIQSGATIFSFDGKEYDISDHSVVEQTLKAIEKRVTEGSTKEGEAGDEGNESDGTDKTEDDETLVVDIDLNDEELAEHSTAVEASIDQVLCRDALDWSGYLRQPYPHQDTGVRWILGLMRGRELYSGGLLADDMGLGKTFMALSSIHHYYQLCEEQDRTKKPTLIVAPLSLLEVWKEEVGKTFDQSPFKDIVILQSGADLNTYRQGGVEIRGSSEDEEFEPRYALKVGKNHLTDRLDLPGRLVITTYQTLRDYQFSMCLIDWGVVVFDEAQNIKNPNALQTRAAKGLKAEFKLVATGTPVENSLADFWCLMDTAVPGYLSSYQHFRERYITPILQAAGDEVEEIRARVGRELRIKVAALMLRRVKEDNLEGLPNKNIFVGVEDAVWLHEPKLGRVMRGYQREVYDGAITSKSESEDAHALTLIQRLRDSSLHPRLADGGRLDPAKDSKGAKTLIGESEKLVCLIDVLDEIKSREEKCIIFCVNKRLQAFLSITLGKHYGLGPLSVINGDAKAVSKRSSTPTRKSMIADFEARDGFNLIIMSPVAAGVGLTVVGANNVVHFERHWNPAKEAQATDRVYRIGQNKDVNIYIPVLLHPEMESFDANLHRLLTKKTQLKDAVVTPEEVMPIPDGVGEGTIPSEKLLSFRDVSRLSWSQFEALALELLAREYSANSSWLTKQGNDFGADGVLDTNAGSALIQVKHTKKAAFDGYKAVQEVAAAEKLYASALGKEISTLYFVTNATKLSKKTRDVAKTLSVEIITGQSVSDLLDRHNITFHQVLVRLDKKRLEVSP